MTGAPSPVETKQLVELGVRVVVPPKIRDGGEFPIPGDNG
jgi:hypothetical protein